jgi:hypothetical protein
MTTTGHVPAPKIWEAGQLTGSQVSEDLLLEQAQNNLIKYETLIRQFEAKYGQNFEAFRRNVLSSHPSFEVEQDYFDWELAVTGLADMEEEIKHLTDLP